jgi:proline iminopeptidase
LEIHPELHEVNLMNDMGLYPEIDPYTTGTLKVSDLHTLFYEEVGNPGGRPALFLHGGPGVGILPDYRRFFDPEFYKIILPDQRGSGSSTPHAEIVENTTWYVVEDLEKLRIHLGIDKWIVMGGSWGSTLALCYAITYPTSVAGIIIRGVFLARLFEIEWLHQEGGASRIYPDEWDKYQAVIPEEERDNTVKAYFHLLTGDDEKVKIEAARAWTRWEAFTMTLFPDPAAVDTMVSDGSALSIGRIECYYTLNGFFMKSENYILENTGKIENIPCRIVQGRYDTICPVISAWELHKALPGSELEIVPDGSHSPMDAGMVSELVRAAEDFKAL